MRQLIGLFLVSTIGLAIAAAQPEASSGEQPRSTSVCELVRMTSDVESAFVSVKAQLLLDHHWSGITDDRCPNEIVFLEWMAAGPSMAFCELNFGCPANTEDFRITATFIGYYYHAYSRRADSKLPTLRLKELHDARRTRK